MSTYELADIAQSNFNNSLGAIAILLSISFAYLAAAYFVGSKLTRMQVSLLNVVFLLFGALTSFGAAAYVNGGAYLILQSGMANPDKFFSPKLWLGPLVGICCLTAIIVCVKFMHDVRHPK